MILLHIFNSITAESSDFSWWTRNEGSILSTSGGILIALFSVFITYYLAKKQFRNQLAKEQKIKDKEEKLLYQGWLYPFYVELTNHLNHFKLLKKSLDIIKSKSIVEGAFITDRHPEQFNLSLSSKVLDEIIKYKKFNVNLIALIIVYINNLRGINLYLDFSIANKLLLSQDEKKELAIQEIEELDVSEEEKEFLKSKLLENSTLTIKEQIASYFDTFRDEYTNKTESAIENLLTLINSELDDYPNINKLNKE